MTALCGGGASQAKPNSGNDIWVNAAGISAILELSGYGALAGAAVAIGLTLYNSLSLCTLDPPTPVALTTDEIADVLTFTPSANYISGIGKLKDLVLYNLWFTYCECASVATPAPAPAPALPPGLVVNPTSTDCGSQASPIIHSEITPTFPTPQTIAIGKSGTVGNDYSIYPNALAYAIPIPSNATSVRVTATLTNSNLPSATFPKITWAVGFLNASGASNGGISIPTNNAMPQTQTVTGTVFANSAYLYGRLYPAFYGTQGWFVEGSLSIELFCGGAGPDTPSPCCPPDPALSQMVKSIYDQVNLLQRYLLPFATILGAAHSGLTNSGSFAVSRLIGVKVQLTTVPNYSGEVIANPNFVYDAGWVSIETGDGVIIEKRIRHGDEVWMPKLFQDAITFGYFLNPGFVATITELEAEPA